MFEKEAKKWVKENIRTEHSASFGDIKVEPSAEKGFQQGAEITLRKVIKYFSTRVLDEHCGGYFSHLLENEEKLQELAKELENV